MAYTSRSSRIVSKGGAIKITGIKDTKQLMKRLAEESPEGLRIGLKKAAHFLKRESKKLVPVDTGDLKRSAYVKKAGTKDRPEYDVGYKMPYAIYVHERLDVFHPVGQAKYLEQPAREYRLTLISIVKSEVSKAVKKALK